MSAHKKVSSAKTGLLPGTPVYVGENPPQPTDLIVHIYDSKSYRTINTFDVQEIRTAIENKNHVWIDVAGLQNSELITQIGHEFNIHPLIMEDLLNTRQRPKLDIVEDFLFIVFKLLESPTDELTYTTEQFSLLMKKNLLLTFRESNNYDLSSIYKRLSAEHSLVRDQGCDYMTYLIMDYIVDDYFNFVEETAQLLETIEDQLIKKPETIELQSLYTIKRRTLTLRKTIAPLRDIVHLLVADHRDYIDDRYELYFSDLHDHCIRLVESIDLHREMSASMLDIYLSTLNNRMNETMKVLTMFASIFIPLTFIVGIYGMNFKFMPELEWRYGYPMVMGGMLLLVLIMLAYFKKKKLF